MHLEGILFAGYLLPRRQVASLDISRALSENGIGLAKLVPGNFFAQKKLSLPRDLPGTME